MKRVDTNTLQVIRTIRALQNYLDSKEQLNSEQIDHTVDILTEIIIKLEEKDGEPIKK